MYCAGQVVAFVSCSLWSHEELPMRQVGLCRELICAPVASIPVPVAPHPGNASTSFAARLVHCRLCCCAARPQEQLKWLGNAAYLPRNAIESKPCT
jgi:hypothetical protein